MKPVISVRDIEELLRANGDPGALPADAIITPSARELLRDWQNGNRGNGAVRLAQPAVTAEQAAKSLSSKSSEAEIETFFNSAYAHELKLQMCDIGRRLWQRVYVDGNGGNIAIRVGEDVALCTPTLVSKGFMKPEDMCLVDFQGNQLCGRKKRTSEILMHLQIMQRQPRALATVHCHPPYSTAFAIAGITPPPCLAPEFEVMASVAVAPYRTPGTPEMGKLVADLVDKHNTVLMANHGVVTWSHNDVEDAYFKMEILEAYCHTVLIATQLGTPPRPMTTAQLQDLLKIKQSLGIPDPRHGLKECELCDSSEWRPGVTCTVPAKEPGPGGAVDPEIEAIVQAITEQVLAAQR